MLTIEKQCKTAYKASKNIGLTQTKTKNQALNAMAKNILKASKEIIKANKEDLIQGKKNSLSPALLDRLKLNEDRLKGIADSLLIIETLPDPIGEIISGWTQKDGLKIEKIRVPLGVLGIIYEARPNVTADAIGLSLKTGNSVVLRGSSSAYNSNLAITNILKSTLADFDINPDSIQLLEDTSRQSIETFVKMDKYLSVIIPRGGAGLIQNVVKNATIPSIETGVGNCHIYIDKDTNLDIVNNIIINAKTSRPSVCNACETVLVHVQVAKKILPCLISDLQAKNVEIRGCQKTKYIVSNITNAKEEDWKAEYLDYILAVKVVLNIDEAIKHIDEYGTNHSEAILSENISAINKFSSEIDAAAILINTSTRFIDGGEFGFGAEIGISTQKLHARGPMGLSELTTYKYVVQGSGQIRI